LDAYAATEISAAISGERMAAKSLLPPKRIRIAARPNNQVHRRTEIARAVAPATRETYSDVTAPALVQRVPLPSAGVPVAVERAALRIKIDTKVSDGTLAIFADHDLLLTTGLREQAAADPMGLERLLPAGPHQLRVALYRADKSLQTEKEGLGELRVDGENTLTIRVTKRPKMLVRRETALEVIWPSAISGPPQNRASSPAVTSALK
jgi:hypothetical protein